MSTKRFVNIAVPNADQFYPLNDPPVGSAFQASLFPQNKTIPKLFTPLKLRNVEFKNRIWVSPMCMYSSDNGHATDFHLVHIGQFALGGAGAIMLEATAVLPEGRISPEDAGIWTDSQIAPLKRIVNFVHAQGGKIGIQLAHAGRKASTYAPWVARAPGKPRPADEVARADENGWPDQIQGPSPIAWSEHYYKPQELTLDGIDRVKVAFVAAIARCKTIGFDFIEVHAAHGYLIHEFYSPLSNKRTDKYGGSLENRTRFALEIVKDVREAWGAERPLFVRISADEVSNGNPPEKDETTGEWKSWGIEQSKWLAERFAKLGVDLIDVSSGGNWHLSRFDPVAGYQVPLARAIKRHTPKLVVGTVGVITEPKFAEQILQDGSADVIFIAREFLRRSNWPMHAARELGIAVHPPAQYERAWPDLMRPQTTSHL